MATFESLASENPNIREQYETWSKERGEKGENPNDYQAFRKHVMAIGAPDPGEEMIEGFGQKQAAQAGNRMPFQEESASSENRLPNL